jgi:tetratricopeptide (TPR) repeat protein
MRHPPRYEEAEAAYAAALRLDPAPTTAAGTAGDSLGEVRVRWAENLLASGCPRCPEQAHALLRKVEPAVSPTHYPRASEMLGDSLRRSGDLRGASKVAQAALVANPKNVRAMLSQAVTYRTMGRVDKALQSLQAAASLAPTEPEVLANLGLALSHSARDKEAVVVYRRAVEVRPDFVEAYVTLGEACCPGLAVIEHAPAVSNCAHKQACANMYDYDCAIGSFRSALVQRPEHVPAATGLVIKRAYICDWVRQHWLPSNHTI